MVSKNKSNNKDKIKLKSLENTQIKAQNSASSTPVRRTHYESVLTMLTPPRMAEILKSAETGDSVAYLTLAEEMEEKDTHYRAVLNTRKQQITGLPINVRAVGEDSKSKEQEEFIRNIVKTDDFTQLAFDLLDGLGKGYSVVEINYKYVLNKLIPISYTHKPPQWFKFNENNQLLLKVDSDKAVELPKFKTIAHIPQLKTGAPIRGGLARVSATIFMLKNFGIKDWASFLEVFGMPLRLGKYGQDATDEDIKTLKSAVANLGVDAGAVISESMEIEFINAIASSGNNSQLYQSYTGYFDEQMSKVILGQTMKTDNGSSLSQSEVHNEVRHDILKADARNLANTINKQLIKPLIDINYGEQLTYPFIEFSLEENEDKSMLVEVYNKAYNMGLALSKADMYAKLNLAEPTEQSDTLISATNVNNSSKPLNSKSLTSKSLNFNQQNVVTEEQEIEDFTTNNWQKIMNPIVESINGVIDNSTSLQDLQKKLNKTNLNTDVMIELTTEQTNHAFINGLKNGKEE